MITSIWVDNFKSLVDFKLELAKFNCIVGLNGSGKSTVLQVLDFIAHLMQGDVEKWLNSRQWSSADINSKLTRKSNVEFRVELVIEGRSLEWTGSFNRSSLSCTKETVKDNGSIVLSVEDGAYTFQEARHDIVFDYQGSILSVLKERPEGDALKAVKVTILNIRSLDLISPELLRSQTRSAEGRLGLGGEKLSSYLHEADASARANLDAKLREIYPQIVDIRTKSLRAGWKQLEVSEKFGEKQIKSTARHLNDGMLRLMAVLLQLEIGNAFLLFDEIENGINPELIEYLIDQLVTARDQVLVTTHSPMILNFIDDEVAKQGVIFLYRNSSGYTRAVRLFDIPSLASKLEFMGPGEAFIDTDLTELNAEIATMRQDFANLSQVGV